MWARMRAMGTVSGPSSRAVSRSSFAAATSPSWAAHCARLKSARVLRTGGRGAGDGRRAAGRAGVVAPGSVRLHGVGVRKVAERGFHRPLHERDDAPRSAVVGARSELGWGGVQPCQQPRTGSGSTRRSGCWPGRRGSRPSTPPPRRPRCAGRMPCTRRAAPVSRRGRLDTPGWRGRGEVAGNADLLSSVRTRE